MRWTDQSHGNPEHKLPGRRKEIRVENQPTFAHVADLLLEDVVAIFIHVGAQEVLESVVDLQPGGQHGDPLPHRVALQNQRHRGSCSTSTQHIQALLLGPSPYLHVLQVLDALDHVLLLGGALCCTLGQASPSGGWTLVVLVLAVWRTQQEPSLPSQLTSLTTPGDQDQDQHQDPNSISLQMTMTAPVLFTFPTSTWTH